MDDDEQQKYDLAFDQLEKPNREFNETETNYQWVHKNMFDDVDEHENNGWRTKTLRIEKLHVYGENFNEVDSQLINKLYIKSKCIEVYEGFCTSV